MSRDLQLKVMLSPEEYVAFKAICDEEGQSQSGMARSFIKRYIHSYALKDAANASPKATDEPGQE